MDPSFRLNPIEVPIGQDYAATAFHWLGVVVDLRLISIVVAYSEVKWCVGLKYHEVDRPIVLLLLRMCEGH